MFLKEWPEEEKIEEEAYHVALRVSLDRTAAQPNPDLYHARVDVQKPIDKQAGRQVSR